MTVGIAVTNGLEAVVITDSRVSQSGRQSDSITKSVVFGGKCYYGVLFATGSGLAFLEASKSIEIYLGDTLDKFVEGFQMYLGRLEEAAAKKYLETERAEIEKKAAILKEKREDYIREEIGKLLQRYEQHRNDPQSQTFFYVTAFDKKNKRIRLFEIHERRWKELFLDHVEAGSGSDGANMYLLTKLQGVDMQKLSPSELAFFAVNAYCQATINQGVGGTPTMTRVSEKGATIVDGERTRALVNFSGAFLAQVFSGPPVRAKAYMDALFNNKNPPYARIAKAIGIDPQTLTTIYIPYSSWQERENTVLFPSKQ